MNERQHRSVSLMQWLLRRDGNRCWYCGETFADGQRASKEHLIPTSRGGTDDEWNLAPAHRECNALAADARMEEKLRLRDLLRGGQRRAPQLHEERSNRETRKRNRRYVRAMRKAKTREPLRVELASLSRARACQVCGKITWASRGTPGNAEALCTGCAAWGARA